MAGEGTRGGLESWAWRPMQRQSDALQGGEAAWKGVTHELEGALGNLPVDSLLVHSGDTLAEAVVAAERLRREGRKGERAGGCKQRIAAHPVQDLTGACGQKPRPAKPR